MRSKGDGSDERARASLIPPNTMKITPDMLPLINISQDDIDAVINQIGDGVANIQDIYPLSPVQEDILLHYTTATKGDHYLIGTLMSFDNRDILDRYLDAFQVVVDRHDIFRTAFIWENLSRPAQVVLRHATISITELSLNATDELVSEQLMSLFDPRGYRINLNQAPLVRFVISQDNGERWVMLRLMHHLVYDRSSRRLMQDEIRALFEGQGQILNSPQPFRDYIKQIQSGPSIENHRAFFINMLAEIDTPTLSFGISEIHRDNLESSKHLMLSTELNSRLNGHSVRMGVSLAKICHLAWALVLAKINGQERVVFGTVISGRNRAGPGGDVIGPLINTLPIRIDIDSTGVEESVLRTKADISALIRHKHASLTLAQKCSNIPPGTPLFNSLFNYLHSAAQSREISDIVGMTILDRKKGTNYPITMNMYDSGTDLNLMCQASYPTDASMVCRYMQQSLQSLVEALDSTPNIPVRDLEVLSTI